MEIGKHMIDTGNASAGQVCLSSYPAIIKEAIERAQGGDMFAPFRPYVLEALAGEYIKGSAYWLALTDQFKQANDRVPLNDLDRAMRTWVATTAAEPERAEINYSVVLGAALAAAEAGDDRAPFQHHVLEALVGVWVRDEDHLRDVGRAFERVNKHIFWGELKTAIEHQVFMMLGTPRAVEITWLANYEWDRPVGCSGESLSY